MSTKFNASQNEGGMDAEAVRAYVSAKWPSAMASPVAIFCAKFVELQNAKDQARADAMEHAEACLRSCDGWDAESLAANIESSFGLDLDPDECDEIAARLIADRSEA